MAKLRFAIFVGLTLILVPWVGWWAILLGGLGVVFWRPAPRDKLKCGACHHLVGDSDKFCRSCGQEFGPNSV